MKSRYWVVETTDLKTRAKTFKLYERGAAVPLITGLATREEAEAKLRELEQADKQ